MKFILMALFSFMFCTTAFAGFRGYNTTTDLNIFSALKCGSSISCTKADNGKMQIDIGGLISGTNTTFIPFPVTATTAIGTSTAGVATTLFLTQVYVDNTATLTGIAINNAATVGTNKYIVALYSAAGKLIASSALAGVTTAGAAAWQKVPFIAPVSVQGASTYFMGVFINGATDNFFTIPAAGEYVGVAGTVTGQTFGTVPATVVLPTTFTAGAGPITHTY